VVSSLRRREYSGTHLEVHLCIKNVREGQKSVEKGQKHWILPRERRESRHTILGRLKMLLDEGSEVEPGEKGGVHLQKNPSGKCISSKKDSNLTKKARASFGNSERAKEESYTAFLKKKRGQASYKETPPRASHWGSDPSAICLLSSK